MCKSSFSCLLALTPSLHNINPTTSFLPSLPPFPLFSPCSFPVCPFSHSLLFSTIPILSHSSLLYHLISLPSLLCSLSPKLRISVITFDDEQDVVVQLPLTSNRMQIQAAIEHLKNISTIGNTFLAPAIKEVKCSLGVSVATSV